MASRKYTEARKENNRAWDAANLDRISVAAEKGTKEKWKQAAAGQGKSLNQFIIDCVKEVMEGQEQLREDEGQEP